MKIISLLILSITSFFLLSCQSKEQPELKTENQIQTETVKKQAAMVSTDDLMASIVLSAAAYK